MGDPGRGKAERRSQDPEGRRCETARNQGEEGAVGALDQIRQHRAGRDVEAVEGRQHGDGNPEAEGGARDRAGRRGGRDGRDALGDPVEGQTRRNLADSRGETRVERQEPEEHPGSGKIGPTDRRPGRAQRHRSLPVLNIEPGPEKKSDEGRKHQAGKPSVEDRLGCRPQPGVERNPCEGGRRDPDDQERSVQPAESRHAGNVPDEAADEGEDGDGEASARSDHRLPERGSDRKQRDRDRSNLVEKEEASIAGADLDPPGRKIASAVERKPEEGKPGGIGDREQREPKPAVGEHDVHAVEEAEAPEPGRADRGRPGPVDALSRHRFILVAKRGS